MRMTYRVAVAGATGYAGGELLRLLLAHPAFEIGALTAKSSVGDRLGQHHPHLAPLADRVIVDTTVDNLAGHDVIALALPHGASGAIAAELEAASPQSILVDLGADHRLESPESWAAFYGGEYQGAWTYGMPELLLARQPLDGTPPDINAATSQRLGLSFRGASVDGPGRPPTLASADWLRACENSNLAAVLGTSTINEALPGSFKQRDHLHGATRIAVPGCNVTAVTFALAPGIAAGVIAADDLVAVLACGLSGAGKAPKPHLLASEILGAASPYNVAGVHRHIPEIEQNLAHVAAGEVRISFTPTLVPMSRGILATCTAPLVDGVSAAAVRAAWEQAYDGEPFVRLLPEGVWPSTAMTLGANTALVQVAVDERARRVVAICAIDNLVKGTAGAAVQSLNLALGLPETQGLSTIGVAP